MSDRKNVNKYYPPEWDPSQGSLNSFQGSHPLRERASRLRSQGILVVRFEVPFPIRCSACHSHIDRGVRFNADKARTGQYLSTPTFSFSMTCHLCGGRIRIDTDPQLGDYVVKEGARRLAEGGGEDDDRLVLGEDDDVRGRQGSDPLHRLEREQADVQKGREALPALTRLRQHAERMKDDFGASLLLRSHMRAEREERGRRLAERTAKGLRMDLLGPRDEDRLEAETVRFGRVESARDARKRRRAERGDAVGLGLSRATMEDDDRRALSIKSRRGVGELTVAKEPSKMEREESKANVLQHVVVINRSARPHAEESSAGVVRTVPPSAVLSSLVAYESDDEAAVER